MRRTGVILLIVLGVAGCFAPFSWPADRREADPVAGSPAPAIDPLTLAAECLDRGDESGAVPHLKAHVKAHPEAMVLRLHLAEVLRKLGRTSEAVNQFERFVRDAQESTGPANERLVQAHTRLMELAEDDYTENLHRGIGLVLLVRKWTADPARRDETTSEQTLSKAVKALRVALENRPGDSRASIYLSEALNGLGQTSASRNAIRTAKAGLPDAAVTEAERVQLESFDR